MTHKKLYLKTLLLLGILTPLHLSAYEKIQVNAPWQIDEMPDNGTAVIRCTLKTSDCSALQSQSQTLDLTGTPPYKGSQQFTFTGKDVNDKANVVCVLSTESDHIGDTKQLTGNTGNCSWQDDAKPQSFLNNVTQTISAFFGGDEKPEQCAPFDCPAGEVAVNSNGDGCPNQCIPQEDAPKPTPKGKKTPPTNTASIIPPKIPEIKGEPPKQCEPFDCPAGEVAVNSNGDGCPNQCIPQEDAPKPTPKGKKTPPTNTASIIPPKIPEIKGEPPKQCEPFDCPTGLIPVDKNGDSCMDSCQEPKECKPFDCPAEKIPADDNGDGCPNICKDQPKYKKPSIRGALVGQSVDNSDTHQTNPLLKVSLRTDVEPEYKLGQITNVTPPNGIIFVSAKESATNCPGGTPSLNPANTGCAQTWDLTFKRNDPTLCKFDGSYTVSFSLGCNKSMKHCDFVDPNLTSQKLSIAIQTSNFCPTSSTGSTSVQIKKTVK